MPWLRSRRSFCLIVGDLHNTATDVKRRAEKQEAGARRRGWNGAGGDEVEMRDFSCVLRRHTAHLRLRFLSWVMSVTPHPTTVRQMISCLGLFQNDPTSGNPNSVTIANRPRHALLRGQPGDSRGPILRWFGAFFRVSSLRRRHARLRAAGRAGRRAQWEVWYFDHA